MYFISKNNLVNGDCITAEDADLVDLLNNHVQDYEGDFDEFHEIIVRSLKLTEFVEAYEIVTQIKIVQNRYMQPFCLLVFSTNYF